VNDVPASWRTISSRSSFEMTPSPSTSNTLKMRRSRSSRVARLLQLTSASTNSCTRALVGRQGLRPVLSGSPVLNLQADACRHSALPLPHRTGSQSERVAGAPP